MKRYWEVLNFIMNDKISMSAKLGIRENVSVDLTNDTLTIFDEDKEPAMFDVNKLQSLLEEMQLMRNLDNYIPSTFEAEPNGDYSVKYAGIECSVEPMYSTYYIAVEDEGTPFVWTGDLDELRLVINNLVALRDTFVLFCSDYTKLGDIA